MLYHQGITQGVICFLGGSEGGTEGLIEGDMDGEIDGDIEGEIDGDTEGDMLGLIEGEILGLTEGEIEGFIDGDIEDDETEELIEGLILIGDVAEGEIERLLLEVDGDIE